MRGIVFFDVDGTLLPGTSSSEHLARWLGEPAEVAEAQHAYDEGRIDSHAWAVVDARGWAGQRPADVEPMLATLPVIGHVAEVVEWCRDHDLLPTLATLAWQPVGEHLSRRFGFARWCGPALAQDEGGRFTGHVASHLDEDGKRDHAVALARELGVPVACCAAVGDSRSDVPLFGVVGLAVALNATSALQELAHASVTGDDLRVVLPVLRSWLAGLPADAV